MGTVCALSLLLLDFSSEEKGKGMWGLRMSKIMSETAMIRINRTPNRVVPGNMSHHLGDVNTFRNEEYNFGEVLVSSTDTFKLYLVFKER